jgi:hypothetical protein
MFRVVIVCATDIDKSNLGYIPLSSIFGICMDTEGLRSLITFTEFHMTF